MMQKIPNFENKILLLPSLSYGMCDSLTLDLLIYNLKFQKVSNLDFDSLYPAIFNLKEINRGIGLPAELYEKDNFVILQIRSTIAPGRTRDFLKQIEEFISNNNFDEVICLGSVNITSNIYTDLKQGNLNLFYHSNSDEIKKKVQKSSKPLLNVNELLGKYQEDVEDQALKGVSKKIQRLKVFNKIPLTIIYGLIRNIIDIEASVNLSRFFLEAFEIQGIDKFVYPDYFKRLQE